MRQHDSVPADQAISKSLISRLSHAFSNFKTCVVPSPQKTKSLQARYWRSQSLLHFVGVGGYAGPSLLRVGFLQRVEQGTTPQLRCVGFSLWQFLLLQSISSGAQASVVVVHGLSSLSACEIFRNRGLNPCPLRWQMDSLTLSHPGSPGRQILNHWTTREVPYYITVEYSF